MISLIDARLRAGRTVASINLELKDAHLLSNGPQTIDDMFEKSYAGYLGEVEAGALGDTRDILAVKVGIPTGVYCNFDQTLMLYQRRPFRRLAQLNADSEYRHGFWLAYKRLERGRFRWPRTGGAIGLSELTLLLEGVDLRVARLRRVDVQRVD